MNFELSEVQKQVRSEAREFARNVVQPSAAERDLKERFDRELFDKLGQQGLTGIPWPQKYGGRGLDYISYVIAVEELSRVCASTGVMLSVHTSLVGWCLYRYGTEIQKQHFLRSIAEGKKLGAFCLTEAGSGSDASSMMTSAAKDGQTYILNGSKLFVTNAGEADLYLVFAMTDPQKKKNGCSAFLIEKGTPGLCFGKKEKKMGIRSSTTMEVIFDHCRVPADHLLGPEGDGFKVAMSALDGGRSGIAAQALGIAQAALDAAIALAKEKRCEGGAFNRDQAVSFKIADMAAKVEAARLLTYHAAWKETAGLPYGKESACAKLFASDTAVKVTTDALQWFGEQGCTDAFPVERYFRDAKITQIYEGTNEIQRLVIFKMLIAE